MKIFSVSSLMGLLVSILSISGISDIAIADELVEQTKPLKISLLNEIYVNDAEMRANPGDHKITSYTEPKFSYLVSQTLSAEIAIPFEVNQIRDSQQRAANIDEELAGKSFHGTRLASVWLGINKKGDGIWGADKLVTWLRLYLPTSELDKANKKNGTIRLDVQLPWTVGNWNFLYLLNPRLSSSRDVADKINSQLSFRQYGVATYNFTDSTSVYGLYGNKLLSKSDNFLRNTSVSNVFETGATYVFNPTINITFYLTNEFTQATEEIKLFSPAKNEMTLSTSISF